jgi:uroporphyrinogen III methyltransferase/synthase
VRSKVYLVGAGPGRPDLITVRGLNILREADVVIYDYLVSKELLKEAKEGAELICCDKLSRRRYPDGFLLHQEEINNLLIKKAREGKRVIRLKNGDPSIFSRCSQEWEALVKEKIEFEVVPGVTAATAASCLTGIPLTDRRFASHCIFVTGSEDATKQKSLIDWSNLSRNGTVVLYMAVGRLEAIIKQMLKAGRNKNTNVAIIQNVSLPSQRVLRGSLGDIVARAKSEKIRPPAIIIVGEVVKLENKFNWLRKNRRILFTGLSRERFFMKGTYFHLPLIKIKPLKGYKKFDNYLRDINRFDWLVFSSRYAVEYFFKRLRNIGLDSRILNNIKIAAIGNSTKERLLNFGIIADLVPKKESSLGLLETFQREAIKGKKIFLPRSNLSDKGLKKELEKLGAKVAVGFAYRNVIPRNLPSLNLNNFTDIVFTSPSTVRNFKKRYKKLSSHIKVRCIGEVTKREVEKQLLRPKT